MNRPSPAAAHESGHSTFSILYLSKLIYRWLWLLALVLFVSLTLAFIYLKTATPYYRATTVLQVEQEQQRVFKSDERGDDAENLKSDDSLKTIEQNLQSPELFEKVAEDPDITQDGSVYVGLSPKNRPLSTEDLAGKLQDDTHVSLRRGTRLIDISVDHPVPEMAVKLSRAVADEYINHSGEVNIEASSGAERELADDSDRIKRKLQKSEDALATYQEALLLKDRISDQQRILDALQQRYRAKHPALIQARALMAGLVVDFDREVRKIRTNSPLETGYWTEQDEMLKGLSPQDRIQTELQLVEARTNVLDGEVETERSLFNNVLKQGSEAAMNKQAAPVEVMVVGEPFLPSKPVRPAKKVILLIGTAGGLVVGLGFVFFLNALDSSFKMAEEVEQYLGLPVLGALPQLVRKKNALESPTKPRRRDNIVLVSDPGGIAAESFRSMRASIGLLGKKDEHRTCLFTSALPGEGKTFVSCNYAVSLAQQGIKTLAMDLDLRVPAVHHFFGLENKTGLVDHISKGVPLDQAIQKGIMSNLDVLTPGSRCSHPAEFLAAKSFVEVLKKLSLEYPFIILDCSPINLVSDPLLVVEHIQSVVLVIRANTTPRRDAKYALSTLQRAGAEPIGVVINAIPDWTRDLYYAHPGRYSGGDKYLQAYT